MGRPTDYDEQIAQRICDEVANGSNLNKLCALDDYPNRTTIYNWFKSFPDFFNSYTRAREDRGDHRFDRIDEIGEKLELGLIDYNVARVLIDAIKWQAGKEKPKLYGDKQELTGKDGAPLVPFVIQITKAESEL